jgi:hypothetical protein
LHFCRHAHQRLIFNDLPAISRVDALPEHGYD